MNVLSPWFRRLIIAATLLLGCCYQLQRTFQPVRFAGMAALQWASSDGCLDRTDAVKDLGKLKRTVTAAAQNSEHAFCRSEWLQPLGNYIELEFSGNVSQNDRYNVALSVESQSHGLLRRETISKGDGRRSWRLTGVYLPSEAPVRILLEDDSSDAGWLSLRARVNFYSDSLELGRLHNFLRRDGIIQAVEFLFALCLAASCILLAATESRIARYGLYFMCSTLLIVRYNSFFFLDDWQFLERIHEHGLRSIFLTQNEHFIPLFAALLYVQLKIFSTSYIWYQLIGLAIHAGNALLLEALIQRLLGRVSAAATVSRILAFTCAAHGLHGEALQWLTTQSISLGMTCRLCAYLFAWNYAESGQRRDLFLLSAAALAGPLIFGGTFSLPLEIAVLLLAQHLLTEGSAVPSKLLFRRGFFALSSVALMIAVDAKLYLIGKHGSGVALNEVHLPDLSLAWRYLLLGSQYGAILRGVGLDDSVYFFQYRKFLKVWPLESLPFVTRASLAGCAISAVLLAYYLYAGRRQRTRRLQYVGVWLLAQVVIASPFLMSAFARLRFGVLYALQGRYCTITLPGVAMLLAPLLLMLVGAAQSADLPLRLARYRREAAVALLALCMYFNQSIDMASRYSVVSQRGQRERIFFEQLADWNRRLGRAERSSDIPFDGEGTSLAGLHPLYFQANPGARTIAKPPPKDPDYMLSLLPILIRP